MATKKRVKKKSQKKTVSKKPAVKTQEKAFDWFFWLVMALIVFGLVLAVMGSLT